MNLQDENQNTRKLSRGSVLSWDKTPSGELALLHTFDYTTREISNSTVNDGQKYNVSSDTVDMRPIYISLAKMTAYLS